MAGASVSGYRVLPLHDLVLVEVLEESTTTEGGVILPDQERSQQGIVKAIGPDVMDLTPGDRVLFDDNGCQWWRGDLPGGYLGAVLGQETEWTLVPESQVLGVME